MPHDAYVAVIKLRIRQARIERNLRQEDVAEQLHISLRSYQRFESQVADRPFDPKLTSLLMIAEALDLDICELVRAPSWRELRQLELRTFPLERASRKSKKPHKS